MVPRRCVLVTETPYSTDGGDVVRMFYDSQEEAQQDFEKENSSRSENNLYVGSKFHAIKCNER